jgi:AcrR family transcriptional regulator
LARRPYSSPVRERQAEATRAAILAAAREEFGRRGYFESTIESVAASAGVAAPTVYANFRSKAGLLSGLLRDAGSDADIRALVGDALREPDPRRRLAAVASVVRAIMEREAGVLRMLAEAGRGRPELDRAWRQVHEQQRAALRAALEPLQLRAGVSLEDAADTIATLASPESYTQLVGERGWSAARWERWLADSAARLVLD